MEVFILAIIVFLGSPQTHLVLCRTTLLREGCLDELLLVVGGWWKGFEGEVSEGRSANG